MTSAASLALAFGEGLALVLSPCILPVLPLMLGASLGGSRVRPFGIVAGFAAAFTLFAVLSRKAVLASGIDADIIRNASLILLMLFGLVMLFPALSGKWGAWFQKFGGGGNALIDRIQGGGFWNGLGIGALIGIVWTPCAGPILAAAIVQIIQAGDDAAAMAVIAAFSLGAGIPMFLIALFGRHAMTHLGFLKKHSYAIRRAFGVVMIASAVTIFSGLDLKLVAWQARVQAEDAAPPRVENALQQPYAAPEIEGITNWINSGKLTMADLKGKVVLIDFWTYSCINCIRTLPYVTGWYDKYKDDGLVVIGVHAPEFPFEKKFDNVEDAVKEYGIHYPVALDNNFVTWRNFQNQYWPAHYLINRNGQVVYTHFGEGHYDVTENNIRVLLGVKGRSPAKTFDDPVMQGQSPETYLGYARAENFVGRMQKDEPARYAFPVNLDRNEWALDGGWTIEAEKITGIQDSALRFNFAAGKVFLVMGTDDGKPIDVDVLVDGRIVQTVKVDGEKLYKLVDLGDAGRKKGLLEIRARRAGLEAYAFTFGK